MPLKPVYGHEALRARLASALLGGHLPQVLLFTGPVGSGKQRLALWLGQAALCDDSSPAGPCGRCAECRLCQELVHPDLHWFVPVARGKASDPAKLVDEVKVAIAETVAERREQGLWEPPDGTTGH